MTDLVRNPLSPFTGFGEETNAAIKFRILRNRDGSAPAWEGGEARTSRFQILHSNDVVKQYRGRGERVLVARLWFACVDDLDLLDSVQGRISTLRYRAGITNRAGGEIVPLPDGVRYYVYPDTELAELSDRHAPSIGVWEATATFRRAVGVTSVAGFAIAEETGD